MQSNTYQMNGIYTKLWLIRNYEQKATSRVSIDPTKKCMRDMFASICSNICRCAWKNPIKYQKHSTPKWSCPMKMCAVGVSRYFSYVHIYTEWLRWLCVCEVCECVRVSAIYGEKTSMITVKYSFALAFIWHVALLQMDCIHKYSFERILCQPEHTHTHILTHRLRTTDFPVVRFRFSIENSSSLLPTIFCSAIAVIFL